MCDRDSYFLELSAYIHLNPVRGGLVKAPHQYPWTSYHFYVRETKETLVDRDFLLTQIVKPVSDPISLIWRITSERWLTIWRRVLTNLRCALSFMGKDRIAASNLGVSGHSNWAFFNLEKNDCDDAKKTGDIRYDAGFDEKEGGCKE